MTRGLPGRIRVAATIVLGLVLASGCSATRSSARFPGTTSAETTVSPLSRPESTPPGWSVRRPNGIQNLDDLTVALTDGVAWTSSSGEKGRAQLLLLQAAASSPTVVVSVDYPRRYLSDLATDRTRLYWVITTDLGSNRERSQLFSWAPGDVKPRLLYADATPHTIGNLQATHGIVLFSVLEPPDYDFRDERQDAPTEDPHEWRVLQDKAGAAAQRVRTGGTGARMVLGDHLIAWLSPEHDRRVRYAPVTGEGRIGSLHAVPVDPKTMGSPADLRASGDQLVWNVGSGLVAYQMGSLRSQPVPGSNGAQYYEVTPERVVWKSDGVRAWKNDEATSTTVSTDTADTVFLSATDEGVAWAATGREGMRLLRSAWDSTPAVIWIAPSDLSFDGPPWPLMFRGGVAFHVPVDIGESSQLVVVTAR